MLVKNSFGVVLLFVLLPFLINCTLDVGTTRVDLPLSVIEGKYVLTKYTAESHTEDIVLAEFGYLTGQTTAVVIYRIDPEGRLKERIVIEEATAGNVRLLKNGNYAVTRLGEAILEVDSKGNVVRELKLWGASHQIVELESGRLLVPRTTLDSFVEIDWSGEVYFEWKAEDHIRAYSPDNYSGYDLLDIYYVEIRDIYSYRLNGWTHLNFVQKLENGNYIVSLRNLSLVLEVDGRTGEIVWTWGSLMVKHQHTPIVYDNYMYVFDNGNGRVVKVDRATGKIVWEFEGLFAPVMGDVRRLANGNLLITDSFNKRVIEVTEPEGVVVWELQVDYIPYRAWAVGSW